MASWSAYLAGGVHTGKKVRVLQAWMGGDNEW
jgi:hypothetical protein